MKVLVTGADGFVGRHLVRLLLQAGDDVIAACRPGGAPVDWQGEAPAACHISQVPLELTEDASVRAAVGSAPDAVVHLAALASGQEARRDPGAAWTINAAGTARLLAAIVELRESGRADPLVLVVSTGEVYGRGQAILRVETDPLLPQSPYAASKVGAEVASLEGWRRAGVRVTIARPFAHTGPGQAPQYVVPTFVRRLLQARAAGETTVPTGNLQPVRDLLDVRDVVTAYRGLLLHGRPGEAYNVARGEGLGLADLFRRLAAMIGVRAHPEPDATLTRPADIPHLVGDWSKLGRATGWAPSISLEQTLRGVVDAEAD